MCNWLHLLFSLPVRLIIVTCSLEQEFGLSLYMIRFLFYTATLDSSLEAVITFDELDHLLCLIKIRELLVFK